jgi:hypothetical protein
MNFGLWGSCFFNSLQNTDTGFFQSGLHHIWSQMQALPPLISWFGLAPVMSAFINHFNIGIICKTFLPEHSSDTGASRAQSGRETWGYQPFRRFLHTMLYNYLPAQIVWSVCTPIEPAQDKDYQPGHQNSGFSAVQNKNPIRKIRQHWSGWCHILHWFAVSNMANFLSRIQLGQYSSYVRWTQFFVFFCNFTKLSIINWSPAMGICPVYEATFKTWFLNAALSADGCWNKC